MYLTTKPGLLKLVTIVVGLVVTAVGCAAHFNSYAARELFKDQNFINVCDQTFENCPTDSMTMETIFFAITIICLIFSLLSLIAGFLLDISSGGLKFVDTGYQGLAGVLIIIAGALILTSAINLDKFSEELMTIFFTRGRSSHMSNPSLDNLSSSLSFQKAAGGGMEYTSDLLNEFRKEFKYADKIAAGVMAILNGLIYFATAAIVFLTKSKN